MCELWGYHLWGVVVCQGRLKIVSVGVEVGAVLLVTVLSVSNLVVYNYRSRGLSTAAQVVVLNGRRGDVGFSVSFGRLLLSACGREKRTCFVYVSKRPAARVGSKGPLNGVSGRICRGGPGPGFLRGRLGGVVSSVSSRVGVLRPARPRMSILSTFGRTRYVLGGSSEQGGRVIVCSSKLSAVNKLGFYAFSCFGRGASSVVSRLGSSCCVPGLGSMGMV